MNAGLEKMIEILSSPNNFIRSIAKGNDKIPKEAQMLDDGSYIFQVHYNNSRVIYDSKLNLLFTILQDDGRGNVPVVTRKPDSDYSTRKKELLEQADNTAGSYLDQYRPDPNLFMVPEFNPDIIVHKDCIEFVFEDYDIRKFPFYDGTSAGVTSGFLYDGKTVLRYVIPGNP